MHMNKHSKEKPFECKDCHKKFKHKKTLEKHAARSHDCKDCDKKFKQKKRLEKHAVQNHGLTEVKSVNCSYCDKVFSRPVNLQKHIRSVHEHEEIANIKSEEIDGEVEIEPNTTQSFLIKQDEPLSSSTSMESSQEHPFLSKNAVFIKEETKD